MSKRCLLASLCLLLASLSSISQMGGYTLNIELLGEDDLSRPAAFAELFINSERLKANANGKIYLSVAAGSKLFSVKTTDPQNYLLIGSGTIGLPADPSTEIVITLRKPKNSEKGLARVMSDMKKLNINISNLDSLRKTDNARYARVLQIQDSLLKVVTDMYALSEAELRSDLERMNGRDKYYPQITAALETYLNEAKDIKDVFKLMASFAMENPASILMFDSTIRVYNEAYNVLNANNNEYEKAVADFWKSNELAYGFRNLFDYAINTIHRSEILHLNTELNPKINGYIHEKRQKKRKKLKEEIMAALSMIIPRLENDLTVLETKTRTYLGKLDAQNIPLNN